MLTTGCWLPHRLYSILHSHRDGAKGRELEVIGSGNVVARTPVFVASEIRDDKRNEELRLRHRDGTPVWTGGERAH
jgi:hypothetical protein